MQIVHACFGWWGHFFGGAPAQSSRREASTWTFLDRLDIFFDAINILSRLALWIRYESDENTTHEKKSTQNKEVYTSLGVYV